MSENENNQIIYGLITKENPLILWIGTDEKEVMLHTSKKEVLGKVVALFKCSPDCSVITFTGFEPTSEHSKQIRNYVELMLRTGNALPTCVFNKGGAKVV